MDDIRQSSQGWRFQKQVSLAMIGAVAIQTATVIWWAGSINERVSALVAWQQEFKGAATDIVVMRSQITDLKAALGRIETHLTKK